MPRFAHSILSIAVLLTLAIHASPVAAAQPLTQGQAAKTRPAAKSNDKECRDADVPIHAWTNARSAPWAALLCVHGLSLHKGTYEPFGKRMAELGIPTYAIDVRGFGSWQNTASCGKLDLEGALRDIKAALEAVHKAQPGVPVVLLGESMGGALALQATALYPELIDGLIACVPAGRRGGEKLTKVKVAAALITAPNKRLNVGEKVVQKATSDECLAMEWQQDPLTRLGYSPRELLEFQKFMSKNSAMAEKITEEPVLFLQGGGDRLVKPVGTLDLYKRIKSRDKTLSMVGGSEHLIFEQGQFDGSIVGMVTSWIAKHVDQDGTAGGASASVSESPLAREADNPALKEARGHFKVAEGYLLLNDYKEAKAHLQKVIDLARGTFLSKQANTLLLSMPSDLIAPHLAEMPESLTSDLQRCSYQGAISNDRPSVICFCADWVDSCRTMCEAVDRAVQSFGDRLNVVEINADDPKNQFLLEKYAIRPLPTVLYLNSASEVVRYDLGFEGPDVFLTSIERFLRALSQAKEAAAK